MMEILVTGASGLVGSRFLELCSRKYHIIAPDYPNFDITNLENIEKIINENHLDVLINFAAFTDVGGAEGQRNDENGLCWKLNVEGTRNLINSINPKVHFIQISTDMVFPGSKDKTGPYFEKDEIEKDSSKVTWYGYTKGQAEKLVQESEKDWTILRLIYPVRSKYRGKLDYLRKPLSLYDQGKLYPMFDDQQVSISFVDEIAAALETVIKNKALGIYHVSSGDLSSPYKLVSYLLEKSRGVKDVVKKSSLDEFLKTVDNPVRYPKYGGLDASETEKALGIKYSTCREIIDKLVDQGIEV